VSNLDNLRSYLADVSAGAISAVAPLEKLLAQAWDELKGGDKGGMAACKLLGRTEEMSWDPPVLTFNLERHGGTVQGSTRAEIQSWTIDIATGTASVAGGGRRQLRPMDTPWKAEPLARELAQLIISEQKDDPRLTWNQKGHVQLAVGKIVPGSNKQTREGRGRRLRAALIAELRPHGWEKVAKHFEKVK